MKRIYPILLFVFSVLTAGAQNWDFVRSSGEYYYGEGVGATEVDADNAALVALSSMIATHVNGDFSSTSVEENVNGQVTHTEYVKNCMKSYTQTTLTDCEKMTLGNEPSVTVRRWMKRTELARVFEARIKKAKTFAEYGDKYLERQNVGLALQYYYWAYALVCSVQHPSEVTDTQGHPLEVTLPMKIRDVLSEIKVDYRHRNGDEVELLFSYQGRPVASELYYEYGDGRQQCAGRAKDGVGVLEMIPGFSGDYCHLDIDYACLGRATDAELESVLNVVKVPKLGNASHSVKVAANKDTAAKNTDNNTTKISEQTGVQLNPSVTQVVDDNSRYEATLQRVISSINSHRYSDVMDYFTMEGFDVFSSLVTYGRGRVVGTPHIQYFKSHGGNVVARGLQMSFSFKSGTKTNFVEDVAFTFDANGKISNVAFGLGKNTENDILTKKASSWTNEARELLMEFLENYKTAYSLERLDYIRDIFADDAIIIVGNVARVFTRQGETDRSSMSMKGKDIIHYNRYTKDQYLKNLERCFQRNDFVNVRFTQSDVQRLEKFEGQQIYGIQLGQDYNSSTYSDFGYLFLMINLTDPDHPYIKVRTWQEKPDPNFGWYNAGDFYE